ncbi:MAG: type II toxin-antitoxin system RelE/ParE family toxin [Fibrobacterota bacterium]|nr:type II toxin-antitoxin system RelE/ParE family toxin [Fibrobacterota bacterium]QQS04696.1 MAG: type II toxin-antitoxin system RelE/ParE family toxin [Fibrobacterota bacterium]
MPHRVVFSPKAWEDLSAILEYLQTQSPAAASRFAREIPVALERLESFPESGRIIPEFLDEGIRRWREILFENLRILYRIDGSEIVVVRVVDARMLLNFQID